MKKTTNCLIRLSKQDNAVLECKSRIGGMSKSQLIRNASLAYWPSVLNADTILAAYKQTDDAEIIAKAVAEYYHRSGYPHNKLSETSLRKEMIKLSKTKDPLLPDNHLQINSVGLTIANHFHPHMVKIKCVGGKRTAYEQFEDINFLEDAVRRWMELGKKPNSSGIRRILRTRDGVRSVVNFKPAIAKYFYDNYCLAGGLALDPCAGFGGRLAGCIASNKDIQYHGIDPQSETAVGNMELAGFYSEEWNFRYRFDLGCAEDIMPDLPDNSYDLIFTSPPFFDVEKYSDSPTQSYVRYPTYDKWKDGFLRPLVKEAARLVHKNGHVIINVKNYKRMAIADDMCNFAVKYGLQLHKTYQMKLSNLEYNRQESTWHTEPIFVFRV